MKRFTCVLVVCALAAATRSACTDDGGHGLNNTSSASPGSATTSPSGAPAPGAHNDTDVTFASEMIPHHAQVVPMAAMVPTRARSRQVKEPTLAHSGLSLTASAAGEAVRATDTGAATQCWAAAAN